MLIAPVVSGVDGFVCMHESKDNKRRSEETAVADQRRIGLLDIIQYVLAGVTVGAALAWNQYLLVPLVLSVAALPYAVWCAIQDLEREGGSRCRQDISQVARWKPKVVRRQGFSESSGGREEGSEKNDPIGAARGTRFENAQFERKIA